MAQYEIKKTDGTAAGTAELADAVYGIEPNIPVIHQVIVCQDACLRQGTHATKNRHGRAAASSSGPCPTATPSASTTRW